jgi:hypothetical protein
MGALMLVMVQRLRPVLGIVPVFEQDRRNGRMPIQNSHKFGAAIAAKTNDPSPQFFHWLFIHRPE